MRIVVALALCLWASPVWAQAPPIQYELRLFANNDYTRLATSALPTVRPGLSMTPAVAVPGGTVIATWSGIATPSPTDWIGVYAAGAPDSAFITWSYVGCSRTPGVARAAGVCSFVVPSDDPPVFAVGDTVQVTALKFLNVRPGPNANPPRGIQPRGALATVLGGPTTHADGTVWYDLNFDIGVDGFASAEFLALVGPFPQINITLTKPPGVIVEINGVLIP